MALTAPLWGEPRPKGLLRPHLGQGRRPEQAVCVRVCACACLCLCARARARVWTRMPEAARAPAHSEAASATGHRPPSPPLPQEGGLADGVPSPARPPAGAGEVRPGAAPF